MSNYAQLVSSFERTGDFPLEANYIFPTVDDLVSFYSDEIEAAKIHKGLLKIVEDDGEGKQALYWVTPDESGNLTFTKLITAGTEQELLEISNSLYELISNVATLEEAVEALGEETISGEDSLKAQIRAIVGCEDCDVLETLSTLDYDSLIAINECLKDILSHSGDLDDLWNKIEGDPLPSEPFQTLRGVEDIITKHIIDEGYLHANMVNEINNIETGVGLNADGSYSADPTTRFLTDATSVMHALRILDSLIYKYGSLDIHEAWYDAETEEIVIVIGAGDDPDEWHEIRIPVSDLIREWEPENADDSPVVLTRTESVEGKDKLSGTLKISSIDNNSLSITEDGELYVDPLPWVEMD